MKTKLVELWKLGVPVKEIAEELGCSENAVCFYASSHRDLCPKRKGTVDYDKLVELWNSGMAAKQIAQEIGCAEVTVCVYASKHKDVCSSRMKRIDKGAKTKLVELWNNGVPVEEISKIIECSEEKILNYVRNHRDVCPNRKENRNNHNYDYDKLVELWNDGVPMREIAEEVGCSVSGVGSYAYRNRDLCPKRVRGRKGIIDYDKLVELWKLGVPVKEIARELGCSEENIHAYVCRNRDLCPKRKEDFDYDKLVELWNTGVPMKEIAQELGCSEGTVRSCACKIRDLCPKRK